MGFPAGTNIKYFGSSWYWAYAQTTDGKAYAWGNFNYTSGRLTWVELLTATPFSQIPVELSPPQNAALGFSPTEITAIGAKFLQTNDGLFMLYAGPADNPPSWSAYSDEGLPIKLGVCLTFDELIPSEGVAILGLTSDGKINGFISHSESTVSGTTGALGSIGILTATYLSTAMPRPLIHGIYDQYNPRPDEN